MNTDFLKETRKRKGLTQGDIAHALGMKTPSWFKIEKGQNNLHPRHWKKVASILGVTEDEISDFAACVAVERYMAKRESDVRPVNTNGMMVDVISSAAAETMNPGLEPLEDCIQHFAEKKIYFADAKQGDFVIEVEGTSMSPWYPDGTLLLVRRVYAQALKDGQRVVAALDDGRIVFKIFAHTAKKICLFSINGDGKDYVFVKPFVPIRYMCIVIASQRNEAAIDEEMNHAGIRHRWQDKLEAEK